MKVKFPIRNAEQLLYVVSALVSRIVNRGKKPLEREYRNILVVKLDEIGDMVLSLHVFAMLRRSYPRAAITVYCKPYVRDVIANDPHIDTVVESRGDLQGRYDLIVELRGSLYTALYALRRPPAYRLDRGSTRLANRFGKGHPHEALTHYEIVEPAIKSPTPDFALNVTVAEDQRRAAADFLDQHGIADFAIMHPGARRQLKKWPHDRFAALARYLRERYSWEIVFIGAQNEASDVETIRAALDFPSYSFVGHTLMEATALCERAQMYVGNDSGPLHLAVAAGCKVLGFYGPANVAAFKPYGARARYIHHKLDCNPCDHIHCVRPENPCIMLITLAEAQAKIEELMAIS